MLTVARESSTVMGSHTIIPFSSWKQMLRYHPDIDSRASQNICDSKTQVHIHSISGPWMTSPDTVQGCDKVTGGPSTVPVLSTVEFPF